MMLPLSCTATPREVAAFVIYGLSDPRTGIVRYVGKTVQRPKMRLRCHIDKAMSHRSYGRVGAWIRSLAKLGLEPGIVIIETAIGQSWREAERQCIEMYRLFDPDGMLNVNDGGNGNHGEVNLPEEVLGLLGVKTDVWIAGKYGLCRETISYQRRRLGIATAPRSEYKKTDKTGRVAHNRAVIPESILSRLGIEYDSVLAREAGVTKAVMQRRRKESGIPAIKTMPRRRGERHHNARVTWEVVCQVREMSANGALGTEIAHAFGVSANIVSRIINWKNWKARE